MERKEIRLNSFNNDKNNIKFPTDKNKSVSKVTNNYMKDSSCKR